MGEGGTHLKILKNNFWNGSYVYELFDIDKKLISTLIEKPAYIQELSEAIQKYIPIKLASLVDRLGNILIQLPAQVLMWEIKHVDQEIHILIAWDIG